MSLDNNINAHSRKCLNLEESNCKPNQHVDHHDYCHTVELQNTSAIKAMAILVALSTHSFLESFTFGTSNNSGELISLFFAIAMHKWSETLVLGFSLLKSGFSKIRCFVLMGFYSILSLIGIIIGGIFEENKVIGAVFKSLTAGTFIYVACLEIITEEFNKPETHGLKLLFLIFGVLIIVLASFFDAD